MPVVWEVEYTDQFGEWWNHLDEDDQEQIAAAVRMLEERGPGLQRPLVGHVESSRHQNMKELIPPTGSIRVLFAFDTRRTAILLTGGDKRDRWDDWYAEMIPVADDLYDEHLAELSKESRDERT